MIPANRKMKLICRFEKLIKQFVFSSRYKLEANKLFNLYQPIFHLQIYCP